MKTSIKIISVLLIVMMILSINSFIIASDLKPDDYDPSNTPITTADQKKTSEIIGNVLGYLRIFGAVLSVIVAAIIGLKYIFSSLEEKANYKENAIPYVVGIFILASATTIPAMIWDLAH